MDLRERFDEIDQVRERRGWMGWLRRGLFALLVVIGASSAACIANYQPMVPGGLSQGDPCLVDGPSVAGVDVHIVRCTDPGSTFTWGFSILNDGPFDIQILDDGLPLASAPLALESRVYDFQTYHVGIGGAPPERPSFDDLGDFPIALPAGREVVLLFRATHRGCSGGGNSRLVQLPVRYEVFGFTRTDWFELPTVVDPCFAEQYERHLDRS